MDRNNINKKDVAIPKVSIDFHPYSEPQKNVDVAKTRGREHNSDLNLEAVE